MQGLASFIASSGNYVEDITHQFFDNSSTDLTKMIDSFEGKRASELTDQDVNDLVLKLKDCEQEIEGIKNQLGQVNKDLAQMRRLNMELSLMIQQFKESGRQDKETADRIASVVRAFRVDTFTPLFSFALDNEDICVTRNQMKQIIAWYPKGKVYFKKFDMISIRSDKVHLFTFGEIAKFINRMYPTKTAEYLIVGESTDLVDVLFLHDFDTDPNEEGVLTPTCVIKSRVCKLDGNEKETVAICKRELMESMMNIGYINYFNDETREFHN